MMICPWCGEEAFSEAHHDCEVLREGDGFNWLGWNALLWTGLTLVGIVGGVGGCVADRWWPQ
jgi:hypothetical protein